MSNELMVFDKISDPIQAVEQMGAWFARSGMFGCEKVEQGQILALACLVERKSPFEILRNYHIVNGRLSKRSDAMLADFNRIGGKHFWAASTMEIATIRVTYGEFKDYEVSYTIKDAERADLLGPKHPSWQKTPDAMLRARCVSKCLRMVAPEIVAGIYTPEEVQDFTPEVTVVRQHSPLLSAPKATTTPVFDVPAEPAPSVNVKSSPAVVAVQQALGGEIVDVKKPETTKDALAVALTGIEADATAWLVAKGWIKDGQTFADLPPKRVKDITSQIREFKIAVKSFKDAAAKAKEKESK